MNPFQFRVLLLLLCVVIAQGFTIDHMSHRKSENDGLRVLREVGLTKDNVLRKMRQASPFRIDDKLDKETQKLD